MILFHTYFNLLSTIGFENPQLFLYVTMPSITLNGFIMDQFMVSLKLAVAMIVH